MGSPTRYRCLGLNGAQRTHIRRDCSDGTKKMFWNDDSNASPRDLIYDPHPPTREPDTSQPVVIVEGEKAADALHARGVSVLGTVCGAGTVPSTDVLRHCINKRMAYLWPDRDHEGQVHMTKIAERLGGDVQMVDLGRLDDLPNEKGADAADWNLAQNADAWAAIKEASSVVTPPDLDALPEAVHDALDALAGATTKTVERLLRTLKQTIPQDADALFCRRIQTEATAQLTASNIPTPATWVRDAALKPPKTTEKDDTPTGVGRPVKFDDPTPWDEPVDGAALLAELVSIIERFMVLPPGAAVAVAGWIVFAWSHDAFYTRPLLTIVSPVKGCGKTTLLALLAALAPRARHVSSMTAATLFRVSESWSPTFLLDEADQWHATDPARMVVLNAGHLRGGRAMRCVGDNSEPREFLCDCPKALAGIHRNGFPPSTLADRSILVTLAKKTPSDQVESWRGQTTFPDTCRKLRRWADDHKDELACARPDMGGLQNRAADNWEPLFASADTIDEAWAGRMRQAARQLFAAAAQVEANEDDVSVKLICDIRRIFKNAGDPDFMRTGEPDGLDGKLHKMEDSPWASFGRSGKLISGQKRGRLLAPFGLRADVGSDENGKRGRGYHLANVLKVYTRYCTPSPDPR